MKTESRFKSIRFKIFAVYMILLLATCLSLFLFFSLRLGTVYKRQANGHMMDVTSLSAANVSNMADQIDQMSVSVIVDQVVQDNLKAMNDNADAGGNLERNKAAISGQIRASVFNISGIISLRIYSKTGQKLLVGTTNREYLDYPFTPDEIYDAGGGALWGIAGEAGYICMGRAILSTSDIQPLGYMVIVCRNDYFSSGLSTVATTYASEIYLTDRDNMVVSAGHEALVGKRFPYLLEELGKSGAATIKDPVTGEDSYFYAGKPLKNGWTLVITVSMRQYTDSIFASVLQMGAVLAAALLLSLAVTMAAVKKLTGPTRKLLDSMTDFGNGRLGSRVEARGEDEIGQIGRTYNQMADNLQNLMEKVYTLEIANKEAEIEFLKMQINPHFLYNSLDTISWLGFANGNEDVSELAVALAALLRASIRRADFITVDEEMQTVQNYLKIQEYRFGDKITMNYQVAEAIRSCYMPSFLLQPLIENSIVHGLEGRMGKGSLNVSVGEKEGWVYFEIKDDGAGMDAGQLEALSEQFRDIKSADSIGLANVYRRLQLLYGKECEFVIKSAVNRGTRITFRIPVQRGKEQTFHEQQSKF